MGRLSDRGKRVATFLRSSTGYPHIRFDYPVRGFTMPHPLVLQWLTCRDSRHAVDVAKAYKDEKGLEAVAYGYNADDLDDVVVVMPLRVYTQLIGNYIDTVVIDRERSKE
jgi:hypothetical protein